MRIVKFFSCVSETDEVSREVGRMDLEGQISNFIFSKDVGGDRIEIISVSYAIGSGEGVLHHTASLVYEDGESSGL